MIHALRKKIILFYFEKNTIIMPPIQAKLLHNHVCNEDVLKPATKKTSGDNYSDVCTCV